jgi:hypothetical protein
MDTSRLLRPHLDVFLLALIFVLAHAAYRIMKKWMWMPVYISCSIGALFSGLLLAFMLFAKGKPNETVTEARNGLFTVLVRSQEFHHSSIRNVDICVADVASTTFPTDDGQCFLHGFDFSGLTVKWLSEDNVEISFACGRVSNFSNFALIANGHALPVEFHAVLLDGCNQAR